jgi:glycosyltransferase involved in cell wall biosynthesis
MDLSSVAVVIPCFKVKGHVLNVIQSIPRTVGHIYCVDDACPEKSGKYIQHECTNEKVTVLFNDVNQGVGGAVLVGYSRARQDGYEIAVKIDGDGQMDVSELDRFVKPILAGEADYTKGNRFFFVEDIDQMPRIRLLGNIGLSFMSKLSSGYWHVFDPTNGYTAIHLSILKYLQPHKLHKRYFFESDILMRLNISRCVVLDIPTRAIYGDEKSNLNIYYALFVFPFLHIRNLLKRLIYTYYLRDFTIASIYILMGLALSTFGMGFGLKKWIESTSLGVIASSGTVMLAGLSFLLGIQFLIAAIHFDIQTIPEKPLNKRLSELS